MVAFLHSLRMVAEIGSWGRCWPTYNTNAALVYFIIVIIIIIIFIIHIIIIIFIIHIISIIIIVIIIVIIISIIIALMLLSVLATGQLGEASGRRHVCMLGGFSNSMGDRVIVAQYMECTVHSSLTLLNAA